ncbi:MAG: hypothetical protein JWQ03_1323 [Variovorax sp.]|nr:hypothetical protein [Variovorax sp.]
MPTTSKDSGVARQLELIAAVAAEGREDQAYDDITRLAADVCGTSIALISLADGPRLWFKTRVGLQATEIPREASFCACAMGFTQDVLVVEDATRDPRFVDNPLVTGELKIRFYAGAPLVTSTGEPIGTLCTLDREPRRLDPEKLRSLQFMAQQVVAMLEGTSGTGRPAARAPVAD